MAPGDKKHFIPLESNPALFTELIRALGMSRRLAFHDVLTLSPDDAELLAFVPRPALALVLVVPAPAGYALRLEEEEREKDVGARDSGGGGDGDGDVVFFRQTIGNACGLFATLHAVCNGEARGFMGEYLNWCSYFFSLFRFSFGAVYHLLLFSLPLGYSCCLVMSCVLSCHELIYSILSRHRGF